MSTMFALSLMFSPVIAAYLGSPSHYRAPRHDEIENHSDERLWRKSGIPPRNYTEEHAIMIWGVPGCN